jgi:hypothetical protein
MVSRKLGEMDWVVCGNQGQTDISSICMDILWWLIGYLDVGIFGENLPWLNIVVEF